MAIKYVQAQTFILAGAGVSETDTSMNLESFAGIDGVSLTMTDFGSKGFGTCQPAEGASEEQISFTGITVNMDGSSTLTGIKSVLNVDPYTETTGFSQAHQGATSFIISNTAGFYATFANKLNDETITGTWLVADPTVPTQIANKEYVDDIAIAGAPNATTVLQGLVQLATQAQYDAKTATGSTTAALVTPPNLNRATKFNDYVADTGSSTAYAIAPSPAITAYAAGQVFVFKAANANTTASPTLNVNSLGAKTIINTTGTSLYLSQIPAGGVIICAYDGTNMQIQSNSASIAASNTTASRAYNASGGTQTIAHLLGVVPSKVTIQAFQAPGATGVGISSGEYSNGLQNCVWQSTLTGGTGNGVLASNIVFIDNNVAGSSQQAAITAIDATNITLTWTPAGTPSSGGNIVMMIGSQA